MFTMSTPKPKHRGFQQIIKENEQTIVFYRNLIVGVSFFRPVLSSAINSQLGFTMGSILSNLGIPIILFVLVCTMTALSLPVYSNTSEQRVVDSGYDLNMTGGLGEHLKDTVILIVLTHILSVWSPLFWYLLLLLPLRALYLSWKYVIRPSFVLFLKSGNSPHDNGKKIKKNTYKGKKFKYLRTIKHWHHFRC